MEVEVTPTGEVRIPRIDVAVDPGLVINPKSVRAQFEGAAVFGTSIALLSEATATGGRVQQRNFDGYQVARMNQAPRVTNVHIVKSDAPPAGIGEPGCSIAPAICNAIFAATGSESELCLLRDSLPRQPSRRRSAGNPVPRTASA